MDTETRELYASSNGDRWYLAHQVGSQQVYVQHVANAPSGAQVSRIDLATFLKLDGNPPEQQALLRLIGTLTKGCSDAEQT